MVDEHARRLLSNEMNIHGFYFVITVWGVAQGAGQAAGCHQADAARPNERKLEHTEHLSQLFGDIVAFACSIEVSDLSHMHALHVGNTTRSELCNVHRSLKKMYSEQTLALPHAFALYTVMPGLKAGAAQPQHILLQKRENKCADWNQQCKVTSSR
jgi:hypothetical protein